MGKKQKLRKTPTTAERKYIKRFHRGEWAGLYVCRDPKCEGHGCEKWHA